MSNQPQARKGEGLAPAELAAWLRKQAKDADLEMMFGTADRFRAAADLLTLSETAPFGYFDRNEGQFYLSKLSASMKGCMDSDLVPLFERDGG